LEKNEEGDFENFTAEKIVELIEMIEAGELSSRGAKDVLAIIFKDGGNAKEVAEKNNLIQKSDPEELKRVLEKILEENSAQVEAYKNGEEKLLQFFVGQGMKATQGSANPGMLAQLLKELLK
jgi:aspartyl-tRNA(Asn)/glutamyl-tRNA(Gln) amidotransferase subunit B